MQEVLGKAADVGVRGVIWTGGGEPTMWPLLGDGIREAAAKKMVSGLYTNGILLGGKPGSADELIQSSASLVFVRLSLNAASVSTAKMFSRATAAQLEAQWRGLANLVQARDLSKSTTALQVSTIIDATNIGDLQSICERAASIFAARKTSEADDAIIVRPLTRHRRHGYRTDDHQQEVINGILAVAGKAGPVRKLIDSVGIHLHLGFGLDFVDMGIVSSYQEVLEREYAGRDMCWTNGLFLTVGPDGMAYLCTDRNCDPEWAIGSLVEQSATEILHGESRRALLEKVASVRCGPSLCEATCRTPRLNRIATAFKHNRVENSIIERIRETAKKEHPLLLS
jgi:hypothetical protein